MTAFFRFRKIFFRLLDPFDLAFGIISRGTDSGIKDRRCQTVRISVILISYGNISKIIGKNSFFQSKLCDSSKCKNPNQDQWNIHLIFQLASVLRRPYQDDQKDQNRNSQKNCTYGHLGMGQIFFCNTKTICQILHIRSCKRCDTVEKKHTVYDSQKQP